MLKLGSQLCKEEIGKKVGLRTAVDETDIQRASEACILLVPGPRGSWNGQNSKMAANDLCPPLENGQKLRTC